MAPKGKGKQRKPKPLEVEEKAAQKPKGPVPTATRAQLDAVQARLAHCVPLVQKFNATRAALNANPLSPEADQKHNAAERKLNEKMRSVLQATVGTQPPVSHVT